MNIFEWKSLPWQSRNELRKKYSIGRSGDVISYETLGVTRVEDDGVTERDIGPLKDKALDEIKVELGLLPGKEVKKETKNEQESKEGGEEASKESVKEKPTVKKKGVRKTKKTK